MFKWKTELIKALKTRLNATLLSIMKNLPRGPEQGSGHCLQFQERCHCQTAEAWSENVSACSAGERHRWLAAAGLPVTRKRKRTVHCCTAAVEMALHSGLAGNDDSHWSLGEERRDEDESTLEWIYSFKAMNNRKMKFYK